MYLLNTRTFEITQIDTDVPKYAILSHRWGEKEVTFQDIQKLRARLDDIGLAHSETTLSHIRPDGVEHTQPSEATQKNWVDVVNDVVKILAASHPGWRKVQGACDYAAKHGFEWIWIDSCCINKESSAELSEAINSMYQYYLEAAVCYVYMSDVPKGQQNHKCKNSASMENYKRVDSPFMQSQWFTRGWTLQELLAPTYLMFVDESWEEIGTKWSMRDEISVITSIPSRVLEDGNLDRYSIAQRMSWAASRKTKRPEDQAYCLMGLFGVSMPPIYGEGGTKAFMRLQQEIIKISDDRSIFAWKAPAEDSEDRGLFARSPYEFRASGEVKASEEPADSNNGSSGTIINRSFVFNNNGLQIHLPLQEEGNEFIASLHCKSEKEKEDRYISVHLKKIDKKTDSRGHYYVRCCPSVLDLKSTEGEWQDIVVKENSLPRKGKQQSLKLLPFSVSCSIEDSKSFWEKNHSKWSAVDEEAVCVTYVSSGEECPVGFLVYPTSGSTNSKDRAALIKTRLGDDGVPPLIFKAVSKESEANTVNKGPEANTVDKDSEPEANTVTVNKDSEPEANTVDKDSEPEANTVDKDSEPEANTVDKDLEPEPNAVDKDSEPEPNTVNKVSEHEANTVVKVSEPEPNTVVKVSGPEANTGCWSGSADIIVTRLNDGGLLYSQLHIMAAHPELELIHIAPGDPRVKVLTRSLSMSSRWGWLVPSEIEGVTFEKIDSLGFFKLGLERDKQVYIPWRETNTVTPADICVLVYKLHARMLHEYKAFVAFGFYHDDQSNDWKIWTDIKVSKSKEIPDFVVKKQVSAVGNFQREIGENDQSALKVTVTERRGLERGSHLLGLEWAKDNSQEEVEVSLRSGTGKS